MHLLGVNCGKFFLCYFTTIMATLVSIKWSKIWNKIWWGGIDNDYIGQGANAISQITQCQLVDDKTKGKGIEEDGFIHVEHETLQLLWWKWKHLEWHHRMYLFPTMGAIKKVIHEFLWHVHWEIHDWIKSNLFLFFYVKWQDHHHKKLLTIKLPFFLSFPFHVYKCCHHSFWTFHHLVNNISTQITNTWWINYP
jgi:hypothetical protein